jgi:hypothetical protein
VAQCFGWRKGCFEAVLRLKYNLAKSELVPVVAMDDVRGLASILGCRLSSLAMTYLGLSLGPLFKAKSIWNDIFEKMEQCLVG